MKVGDKIKYTEKTYTGESFDWDAEIIEVNPRNYLITFARDRRPEWDVYGRAFEPITKRVFLNG